MSKSTTTKGSPKLSSLADEVGLDDTLLGDVVGGTGATATATTVAQQNKIAGFDTSHIDLSAAAVASGAAEAAVAHVVSSGQGTEAGAMHLLESVAAANHQNVVQALAGFGGSLGETAKVGAEIGQQISSNAITAAAAMQGIDAAVAGNHLTGSQASALLTTVAASSIGGAVQVAVGVEYGSLIAGNHITATQAMSDIGNAVSSNTLTGDQAITVLSMVAAQGNAATQAAAAHEAAALVASDSVTFTAASAAGIVYHAVTNHAIAGTEGLTLLTGMAEHGDATAQFRVGYTLGEMVSGNQINESLVISTIDHAVASKAMSGDQAVNLLAGIAGYAAPATQAAAGAEIAALIGANLVTAAHAMGDINSQVSRSNLTGDQAVTLLVGVAAHGNAVTQAAVAGEIAAVISGNHIGAAQAMTDIDHAVSGRLLTADQAVTLLTGVAGHGNTALQAAAGGEIGDLIAGNQITAAKAMADIDHAVSGKLLTGDQAVTLLAGVAAHGGAAVQAAAGGELAALISDNRISAAQAMSDISTAVAAHALTGSQAVSLLAGTFANAPAATQNAVTSEIATLIAGNAVTPAAAMADIGAAVAANALSGNLAIPLVLSLASGTAPGLQTAAAGELVALIKSNAMNTTVDASAIVTVSAIGFAASQKAISGDQAVALLTGVAAGGPGGEAAKVQLVQLYVAGTLTANQAATGVTVMRALNGVLGSERNLPMDLSSATPLAQAVPLLVSAAVAGGVAAQTALGAEFATLVQGNQMTAAQAFGNISGAVSAGTLTPGQAVTALAGMANSGGTDVQSGVAGQIAGMIAAQSVTAADAVATIGAAVSAHTVTADHAVSLLASVGVQGTAAVHSAAAGQIAALIGSNQIDGAQALRDISNMGKTGVLNLSQSVGMMAGVAAASNVAGLESTAGSQIGGLIHNGSVSPTNATDAIGAAVSSHFISGPQALQFLSGLRAAAIVPLPPPLPGMMPDPWQAQNANVQAALGNEVMALYASGAITGAQALASNMLSSTQAATVPAASR